MTEVLKEIDPNEFGHSVKKMREDIDELILEYGQEIEVLFNEANRYYYDYEGAYFELLKHREESDLEYQNRISREKTIKKEQEKADRLQYESLKKKFEK